MVTCKPTPHIFPFPIPYISPPPVLRKKEKKLHHPLMEEKQTPLSSSATDNEHHQQSQNRNCRQKLSRPYEPELALGGSTQISAAEEIARDRLKRQRVEMTSRVWIPDKWGQEKFMKDWTDCNAFDAALASNSKIMFARAALIEEGRRLRANSSDLRIQNRC
ncbi:uncharacterized protein LOC124938002 [Impatiens glandulifera]|uniref:uncharacterized protein LOC124938002 n=1 Tax=Impatiens glandulifera TaxID=253017 RepID=UPI001FB04AFE|nr:uncharacterized protein LOC124938002 [Impatiens glandulifera]